MASWPPLRYGKSEITDYTNVVIDVSMSNVANINDG